MTTKQRCTWCGDDSLYQDYHDNDWGSPVTDDQTLFEFLILEGAQAGLAWITILRKREGYRKAFDQFDIQKVARYTDKKIERLLNDDSIVRNKLKVNSARTNAKAVIAVQKEFGSLANYLWQFVDYKPIQNQFSHLKEVPAETPLSQKISKDLKKRGFKFVGPTIVYAFMQATGMVNDHTTDCYRHKQCKKIKMPTIAR